VFAHTVKHLPDHIKLCQDIRDRSPFYIVVQYFGHSYYVGATEHVRFLFGIDKNGQEVEGGRKRRGDFLEGEKAIRDVVLSLELQIRDYVLEGIQERVRDEVFEKLNELVSAPIRKRVNELAEAAEHQLGGPSEIAIKTEPKGEKE